MVVDSRFDLPVRVAVLRQVLVLGCGPGLPLLSLLVARFGLCVVLGDFLHLELEVAGRLGLVLLWGLCDDGLLGALAGQDAGLLCWRGGFLLQDFLFVLPGLFWG